MNIFRLFPCFKKANKKRLTLPLVPTTSLTFSSWPNLSGGFSISVSHSHINSHQIVCRNYHINKHTFNNVITDYKYTNSHLTCLSFILKQGPFIASLCKNVCFSSKLSRYSLSVCYLNPFSSDQNLSNSNVITQDLESSFFPHLCTPYMILIHSTVSIPTYKQIIQNFISSVQT